VNLPSEEAAAEFARQAGVADYRTRGNPPAERALAGTAEEVRRASSMRCTQRFGIGEFVIDTPVADVGATPRLPQLLLARCRAGAGLSRQENPLSTMSKTPCPSPSASCCRAPAAT
jgi:hypothetical protein